MQKIMKIVKAVMTDESNRRYLPLRSLLYFISICYGVAVKLREMLYLRGIFSSKQLPCIVVSIGNLSAGGTGKTPMTIYVAKLFINLGYKTVVVSRGYKGGAEKTGGVVSNGRAVLMGPDMAGDEPYMMARVLKQVPVLVGRNRFETGMMAIKQFAPDVIVLDDAFQHLKLERDLDLVLLDNQRPLGNTYLLPRGLLREPVSALLRGNAFIFTRADAVSESTSPLSKDILPKILHRQSVFKAFYVSDHYMANNQMQPVCKGEKPNAEVTKKVLRGRKVFAFSGLADNKNFHQTVMKHHCILTGFTEFPDHYMYSDKDLEVLLKTAMDTKAEAMVTTEKDYSRISHRINWSLDLIVIRIQISFGEDEDRFNSFMKSRIAKIKRQMAA